MEVIEELKSFSNLKESWQEFLQLFKRNMHSDSISLYRVLDEMIMLVNSAFGLKILWYNDEENKIVEFGEENYREFVRIIEIKNKREMEISDNNDFVLNILCKKLRVDSISDLKKNNIYESMMSFIDQDADRDTYYYIRNYVLCT